MIKPSQEWAATAWMPPGLHDWHQFITPAELGQHLARHGLDQHHLTGMAPGISPPAMIRLLRQVKEGKLSYADFGSRSAFALTSDQRISYLGHATKNARALTEPPAATTPAERQTCAAGQRRCSDGRRLGARALMPHDLPGPVRNVGC